MSEQRAQEIDVLLPIREVCRQSGLCRSLVYARMRAGTFPRSVHIGSSARWSEREVQAWVAARLAERTTAS